MTTLAPTIEVLRAISRNFNDVLGANQGTRHAPPDLTNDIATLMESLNDNNVYRFQQGRVLSDDTGGAVEDVVLTGLLSLTEGEKTPLTEYNETIQHLQRRRRITSVAEQAKFVSNTTGPRITIDPPIETPMVTPIENEFQDYEGMSVDENEDSEEDGPTEIGQILDELVEGFEDSTLLRLSEEDVALDMDEVVMEVEELLSDLDYDSASDDSESGGFTGN